MSTLEKVGEHEWFFVESECIRNLHDEFTEAMECMDNDEYEAYERKLRIIVEKCPEHIDEVHHSGCISSRSGNFLIPRKVALQTDWRASGQAGK